MTKHTWHDKKMPTKIKPIIISAPDDCVSIDQMESSLPGFMAQMKGQLTKHRYNYDTIFVDHYSRLKYVHLQESLTSNTWSQNILPGACQETWCNHQVLSCPFLKQDCWKGNTWPLRVRAESIAPRHSPMSRSHSPGPMAICNEECRVCGKVDNITTLWNVPTRTICKV